MKANYQEPRNATVKKGVNKMINIRIERDYKGKLQIGTMRTDISIDTWHYADLPPAITTRQQIEALIASKCNGKQYTITYADDTNL